MWTAIITGIHLETSPVAASAHWQQIVCAVDTDEKFPSVARKALEIATHLNAQLMLVHAIPATDELSDNRGVIKVRKYRCREAEEKFAALKRAAGIDKAISIAGGPVAAVVREAALRNGADLVIIGRRHTQRNLGRLRTVAYSIIRSAPCPVLSL